MPSQPRQSKKLSVAAGIFLIFLLIIGDFAAGVIGIASPKAAVVSSPSRFSQSGTTTCAITANTYKTNCSVTFPSAFSISPAINSTSLEFSTSTFLWGNGQTIPLATATFQTSGNYTQIITDNETVTTNTIPNADTNIRSFLFNGIEATSYMLVKANGYVKCTALSAIQPINFKIKYVGLPPLTQAGNTMQAQCSNLAQDFPLSYNIGFNPTNLGTITISLTIGATLTDANTSVVINSYTIILQSEGRIWQNMPDANTELYNDPGDRLALNTGSATSVLFSVMVLGAGGNGMPFATLELDQNSNAACTGTWLNVTTVNISVASPLLSSNTASLTPVNAPRCWRVSGNFGGGVPLEAGSGPVFGTIMAQFSTVNQGFIIDKTSVTTTTLNYFIAAIPVLALSKTLTLTWSAYVCTNTSNC